MRIVLANYGHLASQEHPEQVLDVFHTLTGWATALREQGAEVTVVQGFHRREQRARNGVNYVFVRGRFAPRMARWRIPRDLHRVVARAEPDVVHLNSLLYSLQARHLRHLLGPDVTLVAQHHAERPSQGLARYVQRRGLASVDAFFFNGDEVAHPWREAGLIRSEQPVFEIPEGSTTFRYRDRAAARESTGLGGRPLFLWLGNLDQNKDPLTVLEGFERLLEVAPEARLAMAYRFGTLLPDVQIRIQASEGLARAVTLLGTLAPAEVEAHLNSADYFLQGSHYEGSGYALIEALACGVIPVVTDIPSFRYLTGNGAVGALWSPGDAASLYRAASGLLSGELGAQREGVIDRYQGVASYEAIARQALEAYRALRDPRIAGPSRATVPSSRLRREPGRYLCPECGSPLNEEASSCAQGHRFGRDKGVLSLLSEAHSRTLAEFSVGLRAHRERLGHRIDDETVYDSLPFAFASDFEWRLRCNDLEILRLLLMGRPGTSALDVGSFNGWLSHRLSERGYVVTSVDHFDDENEGLRARKFYTRADWISIQMDLRDLSLLDRVYDVVVLNRCLQFFADPIAYLRHARKRVAPGGVLVVTGLDFFRFPGRKRRAVERLRAKHRERHGRDLFLYPTRGWLDCGDRRDLRAAGLRIHQVPQLRRHNLLSRIRPDRPRFCYGVWSAPPA